MMIGPWPARNSLDHANAAALKLLDFVGIIGKQPNRVDIESFQRSSCEIVVAGIRSESEAAVGFDSIESFILKLVGFQLVDQADPAALLRQIEHNSVRSFRDFAKRKLELGATVTSLGSKNIAREALRMNPDQRSFAAFQSTVSNGHRLLLWPAPFDSDDLEAAKACGQAGRGDNSRVYCAASPLHVTQ